MKNKQLIAGWKEVEIGEVCLIDSGQGAPQGEKYFQGTEIFVRAGDLNNLTDRIFVGNHCKKINKEAIKKYKLKKYKKNSIVFPKSGMSIMTGNIAILKENSYIVNHLAILESKGIDVKFLFYIFKKIGINNLCLNTSYPSIRLSDIKKIKIPLPPIQIQKKIVQILEQTEQLKQKREQADKLTDEYLKSIFNEMFGDPNNSKVKFNKKHFLETIEKEASRNKLKIQGKDFLEEGKYPIIDQGEEFIAGYTNDKLKVYNDKFPVIVFGDHTRILKFIDFPFALGADGVKVLVPKNEFNSHYFYYCLKLLDIKSVGYSRHYKFLKDRKIPLPPLALQQKFASIVENVEKIKEYQKKSRQEIDNLFNVLMQKAFNGELVR